MHKTRINIILISAMLLLIPNVSASAQEDWGTLKDVEKNEVFFKNIQPPEKIMDAIGLRPGMVIGDIGAGAGRFAVQFAARVGDSGKVFANDIDPNGLALIRERCQKYGITNIETILGTVDETGFPERSLDMAFMVYVYHHLERPISLMKKLRSKLKKDGTVVIITGDPDKGVWKSLPRMKELRKQFEEAGYELLRTESFLPRDYLLILKPKNR